VVWLHPKFGCVCIWQAFFNPVHNPLVCHSFVVIFSPGDKPAHSITMLHVWLQDVVLKAGSMPAHGTCAWDCSLGRVCGTSFSVPTQAWQGTKCMFDRYHVALEVCHTRTDWREPVLWMLPCCWYMLPVWHHTATLAAAQVDLLATCHAAHVGTDWWMNQPGPALMQRTFTSFTLRSQPTSLCAELWDQAMR
jgi:hypothetical protein